jgi:hypothetical protein
VRLIPVLLLFLFTAPSLAAAGAVKKLADSQYDAAVRLARASILGIWSGRFDEVLATAPAAKLPAGRWQPSDPHWQAARSAMLARMAKVIGPLSEDPEPRERFDTAFSRYFPEEKAQKLLPDLPVLKSKDYEAYAASLYSGVEFLLAHPELKASGEEVAAHVRGVLEPLHLDPAAADAPSVAAIARREEGVAFQSARDSGVRALVTLYDGRTQLYFNDLLDAFRGDVLEAIAECEKGHRK